MWLPIFENQTRRGTKFPAEKLSNFVLSSHLDPFGNQNDVQQLGIYHIFGMSSFVHGNDPIMCFFKMCCSNGVFALHGMVYLVYDRICSAILCNVAGLI